MFPVKLQPFNSPLGPIQATPAPPLKAVLFLKSHLFKLPLDPRHSTPPPLKLAVLPVKVELVKVPFAAFEFQKIPAPLLAVLLMKLQFFNMPLFPLQSIAPPSVVKLKFLRI